jgi:phosphate transport system substrate-binding protein
MVSHLRGQALKSLRLTCAAAAVVFALAAAACGGDDEGSGGRISADGSSTVGPFATAAAEDFQKENDGASVTVGISGTGGGFERFCRGETDLSNASRPIEDEEKQICEENGVEYVEFHVANDALTVVVNKGNDWATCLTVDELKKMWEPGSKVSSWNQLRADFPNEPLKLYGAGTDSGTFDYFTDVIVGEEGASRSDYSASEDDNVTVQGVSGDKGALGYFGFSYFEQNQDKLKALEIDDGNGCVAPNVETAQEGKYTPLARPLFIYAKTSSFERQAVEDFIRYVLDNQEAIAQKAQFVPLNDAQLVKAKDTFEAALDEVNG